MENANSNKVGTLLVDLVDKVIRVYLEYLSRINLQKAKLTGISLANILILMLFSLAIGLTTWWCALAWVAIVLYAQNLSLASIALSLLGLNVGLLGLLGLRLAYLKRRLSQS